MKMDATEDCHCNQVNCNVKYNIFPFIYKPVFKKLITQKECLRGKKQRKQWDKACIRGFEYNEVLGAHVWEYLNEYSVSYNSWW